LNAVQTRRQIRNDVDTLSVGFRRVLNVRCIADDQNFRAGNNSARGIDDNSADRSCGRLRLANRRERQTEDEQEPRSSHSQRTSAVRNLASLLGLCELSPVLCQ